mmetsp:Transcript_16649/g.37434  ORF Transcript_16649/g.37434 Transcript_16649/m.37434 type:complete len:88 (+) Transcript_16649:1069-1332(+)
MHFFESKSNQHSSQRHPVMYERDVPGIQADFKSFVASVGGSLRNLSGLTIFNTSVKSSFDSSSETFPEQKHSTLGPPSSAAASTILR